ncbi:MAG: ShlB/FhaC/HecB family hemolysin secretion/activation protein [Aquabacterium sp.]
MKKLFPALGTAAMLLCGIASMTATPALAADAAPVAFDVFEYVIVGNTVLPPDVVEKAVHEFMGPGRTLKDVEAARSALEKAYQDAGYLSVVVNVPNQRVSEGEVTLEVVQAQVEKLKVTGAQYNLPSKIAQEMPSVQEGQVPYFPQMQEELNALQRSDLQLTPLISAGTRPDQIQVELKVEDKPSVTGNIELNNKQSFNTRRGRLEALLAYNNLWQLGHSAGFSWQYAPWRPSDANTLTAIYGIPLRRGDSLNLSFTRSDSDTPTGTSLGGATLTKGQFFNARWRHDLPAGPWPVVHAGWAGFDIKNNKDSARTGSGLTTQKPALRYVTLGFGYDLNIMGDNGTSTGVRVGVDTGTRHLAGKEVDCEGITLDQFACKRAGAKPDFMVLKLGADHSRELYKGWRLEGNADAQLASGPLVAGEQFSLGGTDSVRGYYDYEQVGDVGWNLQLNLKTPKWFDVSGWQMSGQLFTDRGFALLHEAVTGQLARVHLGSVGAGVKVENGSGLRIDVDVARPLFETQRAADSGGFKPATDKRPRWHVRARQEF